MKFRLTSEFGELSEVRDLRPHTGIDFAMPEGTKLRSIFNGTVEKVYHDGTTSLGNGVKIELNDGTDIIYGHMKQVNVHVGDKVWEGDLIGLSGNTGNSTGAHLHFAMQKAGQYINPKKYAEKVANMSGEQVEKGRGFLKSFFGVTPLGDHIVESVRTKLRDETREKTIQIALGIFDGLSDILLEVIGAVSLVGCTILIIMRIAGYGKGFKYAGVLFVLNVLVKALLGGEK